VAFYPESAFAVRPTLRSLCANALDWLRYPGYWGNHDLDGIHEFDNLHGDNAPLGPVFLSSGFDSGTRWLDPWIWSENFNQEKS